MYYRNSEKVKEVLHIHMCERGYEMEIKRFAEKLEKQMKALSTVLREEIKKKSTYIKKIEAGDFIKKSQLSFITLKKKLTLIYRENKHKKSFIYGGAGALVLVLVLLFNFTNQAYEIKVEDKTIAIVRNIDEFTQAVDVLKEEVWQEYQQEFVLPENIVQESVKARKSKLTNDDEIIRNLKEQIDLKVKAVAILVNGQEVTVVNNKQIAKALLEDIKAPYVKEDGVYEKVNFAQSVEVKEVAADIASIRSQDEARTVILTGTDEEKIHEVQSGENSWVIAQKYKLSVDDIVKANPTINADKLKIGQEISLVVPKPYISVMTKEYVELVEHIPFETETVTTESLYKGDKKITVQGSEGKVEIKGYIVRENGIEINREIVQEKIISEPTTRVVAEGTKPRPATVASGAFSNPTRGRLTSRFGMRGGSKHTGIDIAAPTGTSIASADAGRVSFSGWSGSYGNLVIIDHENGYQTYYAHSSKLLVGVGQRVFKGQHIANVGSTGRSTGPHLHFEVRKNGTPINPSQFVRY